MNCETLLMGLEKTGTGKAKLERLRDHVEKNNYSGQNDAPLLIEDCEKMPKFAEGTLAKMRAVIKLHPGKVANMKPADFKDCKLDKDSIKAAMKKAAVPEEDLEARRARIVPHYHAKDEPKAEQKPDSKKDEPKADKK